MYPYQGGYGQPQYGQQPMQPQQTGFMPMQVSSISSRVTDFGSLILSIERMYRRKGLDSHLNHNFR